MEYYAKIEIPNFIEKIKLSEKRRAKYYKKGDKIPKKYQNNEYDFNKGNLLIDVETGEKIIKNTRTVGTPNLRIITGQSYWQGIHPHIRRKMKKEMSEFFCPFISKLPRVKTDAYPLGIDIDLYDEIEGGTHQDLDNFMLVYRKVIHDVLVDKEKHCKKIIQDDSKDFIRKISSTFYPIEDHKDRKLVIIIYTLKYG